MTPPDLIAMQTGLVQLLVCRHYHVEGLKQLAAWLRGPQRLVTVFSGSHSLECRPIAVAGHGGLCPAAELSLVHISSREPSPRRLIAVVLFRHDHYRKYHWFASRSAAEVFLDGLRGDRLEDARRAAASRAVGSEAEAEAVFAEMFAGTFTQLLAYLTEDFGPAIGMTPERAFDYAGWAVTRIKEQYEQSDH